MLEKMILIAALAWPQLVHAQAGVNPDNEVRREGMRRTGESKPSDTVEQMRQDREAGMRTPHSAPPYGPMKGADRADGGKAPRPSDGARAAASPSPSPSPSPGTSPTPVAR